MTEQASASILDGRLLDAEEVAQLLGVSPATVANLARRNTDPLPSVRLGRARRFVRTEVGEWLDRQRDSR